MSFDYIRKIVSGNKARFVDHETATNLDLVYVTDRILIMGWPATGIASYYRNRRRDVLKFINGRHGDKWWVWNLCPLYENAYSPESMHNRVSRYPFPDHHPPPVYLLPLAVKEISAWLAGDDERVAIIHCKAGKGRSGTLLCSYMLSLPTLPPPPELDRSYPTREAIERANQASKETSEDRDGWVVIGGGDQVAQVQVSEDTHTPAASERLEVQSTSSLSTASRSPSPLGDIPVTSDPPYEPIDVGDEAKPGAAGQGDREDGKVDAVFRLHSSRRMKPSSTGRGVSIPSQRRWVRYIHLIFSKAAPAAYLSPAPTRVRLVSVTMLLSPLSGWQKPLASVLVGSGGGQGRAWASVARYDDNYVNDLKQRGGAGEGSGGSITWGGVGGDGVHDSQKMFRSFGKMVAGTPEMESDEYIVHHLVPDSPPLILDRAREFRLKLHLGSLPLGWIWLIPAFHLPEPLPPTTRSHTLVFTRSQVDFPLGPGQAIHKVLVKLEEVPEDDKQEPARLLNVTEEKQAGVDDQHNENVNED